MNIPKPCKGCAFTDPEAWVADQAMCRKIQNCLTPGHTPFFCHDSLPQGGESGTTYLPPLLVDGRVDTDGLTPCAGFTQWQAKQEGKSLLAQQWEVFRLQHRMCTRFLKLPLDAAQQWRASGFSAGMLAEALNLIADKKDGNA